MLCVIFYSVTEYNSAVVEFITLPPEQRIKLVLNTSLHDNILSILRRALDVFDSRIIRESMTAKMQKLLQCTVVLVKQTALRALCFFFKQTARNMQARPWSLVSILALLYDVKHVGCVCF